MPWRRGRRTVGECTDLRGRPSGQSGLSGRQERVEADCGTGRMACAKSADWSSALARGAFMYTFGARPGRRRRADQLHLAVRPPQPGHRLGELPARLVSASSRALRPMPTWNTVAAGHTTALERLPGRRSAARGVTTPSPCSFPVTRKLSEDDAAALQTRRHGAHRRDTAAPRPAAHPRRINTQVRARLIRLYTGYRLETPSSYSQPGHPDGPQPGVAGLEGLGDGRWLASVWLSEPIPHGDCARAYPRAPREEESPSAAR